MSIFGAAKRGLGILGKKMTGSHKIKKGGWQDMTRPKDRYSNKKDWEIKLDREDMASTDRKLNVVKNVSKGAAGALVGSYAYGKWQRHKRSKKKGKK
jgi:hypothetical protein